MNTEKRIVEQSQHTEDPNPQHSVLFMRCNGRVSEYRAANPTQKCVVAVRMIFNRSVNEHRCRNEPRSVEADKTSDMAFFHAYVGATMAFNWSPATVHCALHIFLNYEIRLTNGTYGLSLIHCRCVCPSHFFRSLVVVAI